MQQNTEYPDPEQLKAFAREPMPFHDVTPGDLEYFPRTEQLKAYFENVTYRYWPTYINVETAENEWERAKDVSWVNLNHEEIWHDAGHIQVEEDFICATMIHPDPEQPYQCEAYWILGETTIGNPDA